MTRTIATTCAVLACGATLATVTTAQAQEDVWRARRLAPPSKALEISVGSGVSQGLGQITPSQRLIDTSGPGVAIALAVDYRLHPHWSLGLRGEYEELGPRNDDWARGFAADAGVTYHARPRSNGDPWVRLGSGYRIVGNNATTPKVLVHAVDVAAITVGYDLRVDSNLAFAPVVGADVDLFAWEYTYSDHLLSQFARPQVGGFVFAGLQARFDITSMARTAKIADSRPAER